MPLIDGSNFSVKTVPSCLTNNVIFQGTSPPCENDASSTTPASLMGPLSWILFIYILLSFAALSVFLATGWLDLRLNVNSRILDAIVRSRIENDYVRYVRRHNLFEGSVRPPSITAEIMRADTVARWMARERYIQMTGFEDLDPRYMPEARNRQHQQAIEHPQRTSSFGVAAI